jgi:hypothetical protein
MLNLETIRDLVKIGVSSTDIAKQFGSTPRKVQQFVRENDLGPWVSKTKTLKHDKAPIPDDFIDNAKTMTLYAMEAYYRRSYSTILQWFETTGVERLRTVKNRVPDNFEEMVKTKTINAIAEELGCGRDAVRRMIKSSGLEKPRIVPAKTFTPKPVEPKPKITFRRPMGAPQAPINPYTRDMSPQGRAQEILQGDRWVVYRCNESGKADVAGKFWFCGSRVITGQELLERAERVARRANKPIPWREAA